MHVQFPRCFTLHIHCTRPRMPPNIARVRCSCELERDGRRRAAWTSGRPLGTPIVVLHWACFEYYIQVRTRVYVCRCRCLHETESTAGVSSGWFPLCTCRLLDFRRTPDTWLLAPCFVHLHQICTIFSLNKYDSLFMMTTKPVRLYDGSKERFIYCCVLRARVTIVNNDIVSTIQSYKLAHWTATLLSAYFLLPSICELYLPL